MKINLLELLILIVLISKLLLNLLELIRMKSYRKFWNVVDKNQLKDGWVEGEVNG